jgi:hypothetical protein
MGLDDIKLGVVLSHAIQNQGFRQAAKNPASTPGKLRNDPDLKTKLQNAGLDPLNDEEIALCQGWALLAHAEFGANDGELLQALNDLQSGGPGP